MKRTLKLIPLVCMIIMAIFGAGTAYTSAQSSDGQITIVFTHDIHDHLLPFSLEKNGVIKEYGGLARIQTAINMEREKDPDLLLVDAGDFSMGTLFQTIFAEAAPGLSLLGQMNYDAVTLGNHEFDYRAEGLADCLNAARENNPRLPELLTGNIVFPVDKEGQLSASLTKLQKAMQDYPAREYIVLERNNTRIGIFALMGKEAASNAPMAEVEFTDPIEAAQRITKVLQEQEKVDLILCLSHSGTSDDEKSSEDEILASQVPAIDVIISAHSHTRLNEPIIINDTIICSTGEYGENLGLLRIKNDQKGKWLLSDYRLLPVDESLMADPAITARLNEFRQRIETDYLAEMGMSFAQVLAYSPFSFLPAAEIGEKHAEEPLANLISDAYIYAVKIAEGSNYEPLAAAVVPSGTIRGSLLQGDITVADVYAISSLGIGPDKKSGYPIISVYLTGKELKTACEVDASVAPLMKPAQLYIAGMTYSFNPHRMIFNKVTSAALLKHDGSREEIDDNRLYRVAAGLYSAQMLSVVGEKSFGLLSIVPKDKQGRPIENFEEHIIKDLTGGTDREIKEWAAIAAYLGSFSADEDVPQIPLYYSKTQGRKMVIDDNSFSAVYSQPNHIAITIYIVVAILVILMIYLVLTIIKKRRDKARVEYEGKTDYEG